MDHIGGFYQRGASRGEPFLKTGWQWKKVRFLASGSSFPKGYVDLSVHPAVVDGFKAVASVFYSYGYAFRESAGGTVNMRNITGATQAQIERQIRQQYPYATSIHAHGCALDINPSKNPFGPGNDELDGRPDIIASIKKIVTIQGYRVVRWGGDWSVDDDMHFEVTNCTRPQLEKGINWNTVRGWKEYVAWIGGDTTPNPDPDPAPVPVPEPPNGEEIVLPLEKGQRSEDVRMFKDRMNETFEGKTGLGGVPYKMLDIAHPDHGDWYEDATTNRVRDFLGEGFTGSPEGKAGTWVGGQQWNSLLVLWMKRKLAVSASTSVDSTARSAAAAAQSTANTATALATTAQQTATTANAAANRANDRLDNV